MYIGSPIWTLKQYCPCCDQVSLDLYTCEECKKMFAICAEVGTVFTDPLDILESITSFEGGIKICKNCGAEKLRPSKDFEIIDLGLSVADYE